VGSDAITVSVTPNRYSVTFDLPIDFSVLKSRISDAVPHFEPEQQIRLFVEKPVLVSGANFEFRPV
jgi:hypothetical protein